MNIKRHAILIGNNNGLPGIHQDLEGFEEFLCSDIGGAWIPGTEISKAYDVTLEELNNVLKYVKNKSFDYLIFYYSGHGGLDRSSGKTILELNDSYETIAEEKLFNLADRQLNIFDCCRSIPKSLQKSHVEDSALFSLEDSIIKSRALYNNRIMQSYRQQINLYACSKFECANATGQGSIYTQNLIKEAKLVKDECVLVLDAHKASCKSVAYKASLLGEKQNPDYEGDFFIPKERQLILSIPRFYLYD